MKVLPVGLLFYLFFFAIDSPSLADESVANQVQVEAKIVETQNDFSRRIGVDFHDPQLNHVDQEIQDVRGVDFAGTAANSSAGLTPAFDVGKISPEIFNTQDTKILSAPRVTTLQTQPAEIQPSILKDLPVIGKTFPKVQEPAAPLIQTRQAQTRVAVKDSQTTVIGGLVPEETPDTEEKIPVLGDIPFLGKLFQNKDDAAKDRELMVMVTPHIVRPAEQEE